uniref:Uncharacterized protein n=1 Tax=Phlebotomus papatasi TaxID=29031 RepID=A0A1B0D1I7_PHLPP
MVHGRNDVMERHKGVDHDASRPTKAELHEFTSSQRAIPRQPNLFCYMTEAATKIQAVFRGHKVRAAMKQGDSTAVNGASEESKTEPPPSKEELEAEFDPNDKEFQPDITDIESEKKQKQEIVCRSTFDYFQNEEQ